MRRSVTVLFFAAALASAGGAHAQMHGSCLPGTAERDLDVSDVRARLFNGGNLFYGNTSAGAYFVPKESGRSPIYSAALWVGGYVGGELRTTAATYQRFEFWPGPLDDGATLPNPSDCSAYDRIWVVSAADVAAYEAGGTPTSDLAEWPVGLGAPAVGADGNPIVPTSREQVINLAAGERPVVYGSQTAFWVMNDVGNVHAESDTAPIGLEAQVLAFAVTSPEPALNQATFYRYRLINRSAAPLDSAYTGVWFDADLGDASDDYTGSDTTRGFHLFYNSDNEDGSGDGTSYGLNPPAVGFDLLSGAGTLMTLLKSRPFPLREPMASTDFYNYLRARWNDGTPLTEGDYGYESGGPVLMASYPGDAVTGAYWSQRQPTPGGSPHPPEDQRSVVGTAAFTLGQGEAHDFTLAIVFAQGVDHLDSVTQLRAASDRVQAAYDDGSLFDTVPVASEPEPNAPAGIALLPPAPNPSAGRTVVPYTLGSSVRVRLAVYDVLGREVAVLADGVQAAGRHEAALDARGLPAGAYLLILSADGTRATQRLVLTR